MPPPRRPRDDIEVGDSTDAPQDRSDGSIELSQRTTFRVLFNDPAVRNYVIAAFAALGMIFLVLFQQGSDLGGLLIVVVGAAGIALRWVAAPVFVLLVLTYFMVFPFGIPGEAFENRWEIADARFRVPDLMLAAAVLVYVACQYRIFGFVHQAVAYEGAVRRSDEPPTRRPPALVTSAELGTLFAVTGVVVVAAQLVWLVANSIEVVPTGEFPLRWVGSERSLRRGEPPGGLSAGGTRFVVLAGLLFFVVVLARLVFGYWRLRTMGPAEGAMVLLDSGWAETHRERVRLERWRVWGRKRAEQQAKAAADAEKKAAADERKPGRPSAGEAEKKAAARAARTGGKR